MVGEEGSWTLYQSICHKKYIKVSPGEIPLAIRALPFYLLFVTIHLELHIKEIYRFSQCIHKYSVKI